MKLKGKKIACFVALPHHTRFLLPLAEASKKYGANVIFFLTMSDYPFERDLVKNKVDYKYLNNYTNDEGREKIEKSYDMFMEEWVKKCFAWDGFRHWSLLEQERLLSTCFEEYFCLEEFIKREKPDIFLALHERNRWGKLIGHLSNQHGIPFITLQEGDYHESRLSFSAHTEYSTADLLWGEATMNMLVSHKCSGDKIVLVGNTHLDNAKKMYLEPARKKQIKAELKIPEGKKVLLFLVDLEWGAIIDGVVWEKFLDGLSDDIVAVFKWHPNIMRGSYLKIEERIKERAPSAVVLYTYDPYALLSIADYCVTLGKTTLALEAVAFDKPLFAIPSRDGKKDYYVEMGVAQSVFPPGNWKHLYEVIENGVPEDIKRNVEEYLRQSFYRLDGKAVERGLEVISHILECRQDKAKGKGQKAKVQESRVKSQELGVVNGRASFIIPSGNDAESLLSTLTSLSQNVKYPDWEVVIVINDENMKEMLSGISGDIRIVDSQGDNLSLLYNKGAEASTGEYLIFMKPGIVYFKDEGLLDALKGGVAGIPLRNPDMTPYCLGIGFDFNFAPYFIKEERQSDRATEGTVPDLRTGLPVSLGGVPEYGAGSESGLSPSRDAVGGGLIGMHRRVFESIGGFDEGIANHLIEVDACLSAKDKDYPVKYLPDCLGFVFRETFIPPHPPLTKGQRGNSEPMDSGRAAERQSDSQPPSAESGDEWKQRIRFFAKWWGKLPKDDDYIKFAGDLLKV